LVGLRIPELLTSKKPYALCPMPINQYNHRNDINEHNDPNVQNDLNYPNKQRMTNNQFQMINVI